MVRSGSYAAPVWAWMEDMDLRKYAMAGLAAASIAKETVKSAMNAPAVRSRMK